ncbi:MAG: hypothetical protein Q8M92_07110, partial [Candidatus Subteraquimicrobiales bacterium]|nr:hypothetical protein [Candidatus Subteraquimicrobiales bacterium]
ASFLASISLWDIYLSRGGFEAHFALFLSLFGTVLFLYKKYIPMAFLFGIAIFTYPTFKLTLPLLLLALMVFSSFITTFKNKSSLPLRGKQFIISVVILAIFAGFNLRETFYNVSESRFLSINIFADSNIRENIIQRVNEKRFLSTLPEVVKPFIYNKPVFYARILLDSYIENLSPQFLFLRGDGNPRNNPGEWGMLYIADAILLAVGLYFLIKEENKQSLPLRGRKLILLVSWILIVPLATMLIGEIHALRNNLMLPPFLLITAYALTKIPKNVLIGFTILIGLQLATVLIAIYFYAPYKFGSFWSAEAKRISLKAISETDKTKTIILSNKIDNIEYAYPVYAKIDPKLVISQYQKWPKVYGNVIISNEK